MFLRLLLFSFMLSWLSHASTIKSITGNIILDSNNDGASEVRLSANGLAIGTNLSPSANLHLQGNGIVTGDLVIGGLAGNSTIEIQGSIGYQIQTISSNTALSGNSVVFVDFSSDNITLTLPYAGNVIGREYTIKKTSELNQVILSSSDNIDSALSYSFTSGNLGSMKVMSNGTQWFSIYKSSTGINAGGNWTPSEISPLAWWDASDESTITESGGSVSQWDDKSTNGYDLTQAVSGERPTTASVTINGLNTIDFDGSNDELINTSMPLDDPFTIYAVGYSDSNGYRIMVNGYTNAHYWFGAGTGSQNFATFFGNGAAWNDVSTNSPAASVATISLMGVVNAGATATPYHNGIAQNTKTGTMTAETGVILGRYSGGQLWDGPVAEVLIFSNALNDDDRQKLEGYLAHKWGLEVNLDANHPYRNVAP